MPGVVFFQKAGFMKKVFTTCILIYGISLLAYGQRMPFFIQYVVNPYLYNPAFTGYDKHPIFQLTHRQQWLGIEGAPVSSSLSFQTPLSHTNPVSLGGDIANDRIGILNYTTARATFAYLVPLGVQHEHYLRFGLSAGLAMQQYDLSDVDIADDILLQQAAKNLISWDGRFGLQYHFDGFNLGVSLPHIFGNQPLSPEGLSTVAFDVLERYIISASYKIKLNPLSTLAFEPIFLYNASSDGNDQLEGFGMLHIKDAFWVGGGYQQQAGIAGLMGFKTRHLKFGYAYGMGGNALASYGQGTHEVLLGLIVGKKREVMKRKPRLSTSVNGDKVPEAALLKAKTAKEKKKEEEIPDRKKVTAPAKEVSGQDQPASPENGGIIMIPSTGSQPASNTQLQKETSKPVKAEPQDEFGSLEPVQTKVVPETKTPPPAEPVVSKPTPAETVVPAQTQPAPVAEEPRLTKVKTSSIGNHPLAMKVGKYIVVGTFSQEANARKLVNKLKAEGYPADMGYHTERNFYYVHIASASDVEVLKTQLRSLRQASLFENAWILSVEE